MTDSSMTLHKEQIQLNNVSHAFLCMNNWALETLVTSVQNVDI